MGQWYLFRCPKCSYETECSEGPDRGMFAAVDPMICKDCKEVHNVATGVFDKQGNYEDYEKPECPSCEGSNLKIWKKRECPKCGDKMERSNQSHILWD
jgi:peptide subunit release factor 1 (eRF1)